MTDETDRFRVNARGTRRHVIGNGGPIFAIFSFGKVKPNVGGQSEGRGLMIRFAVRRALLCDKVRQRRAASSGGGKGFPFVVPGGEQEEAAPAEGAPSAGDKRWRMAPRTRILHPDWSRLPMAEDDPRMIGDYPDYGSRSYQERDPQRRYFDQQGRRHFGEGVPEDYEALSVWAPDISRRYGWPWMLGGPAVLIGATLLVVLMCKDVKGPVPVLVCSILGTRLRGLDRWPEYFVRWTRKPLLVALSIVPVLARRGCADSRTLPA